jgi:hypothetical protein
MKTAFYWGLIFTALAGSATWGENATAPTASPTSTPIVAPTWAPESAGPTPTPIPEYPLTQASLPRKKFPFYLCIGAGPALPGFGFGSAADDPWLGAGGAAWAQGYGRDYAVGPFVQLKFGKYLTENLAAELDLNYDYFGTPQSYPGLPNSNYYSDEINVIPTLRYDFLVAPATPYLLAGAGLNVNRSNSPTGTQSEDYGENGSFEVPNDTSLAVANPLVTGGAGLLFNLLGGNFYIQAQCDYVFTDNGGFAYFPLVLGFMGAEMQP